MGDDRGSTVCICGVCVQVDVCAAQQYFLNVPCIYYHTAFARFSEAILDYLADEQRANSGKVQFSQFEGHIFSSFDQLFNVWLLSKESRVSNA